MDPVYHPQRRQRDRPDAGSRGDAGWLLPVLPPGRFPKALHRARRAGEIRLTSLGQYVAGPTRADRPHQLGDERVHLIGIDPIEGTGIVLDVTIERGIGDCVPRTGDVTACGFTFKTMCPGYASPPSVTGRRDVHRQHRRSRGHPRVWCRQGRGTGSRTSGTRATLGHCRWASS